VTALSNFFNIFEKKEITHSGGMEIVRELEEKGYVLLAKEEIL
jgi:Fe-S cluster assembly ATPase SufC